MQWPNRFALLRKVLIRALKPKHLVVEVAGRRDPYERLLIKDRTLIKDGLFVKDRTAINGLIVEVVALLSYELLVMS
jgi:hypothetical protein